MSEQNNGRTKSIADIMWETDEVEKALKRAFNDAVMEHRRWGHPMVFWKDGQVVEIPADQVKLIEVPAQIVENPD